MRSVGWAFALEFWMRHRFLSVLTVAYLLALVTFVHAVPAGTLEPSIVPSLTVPLWGTFLVLIALFSHGENADILARESGYPRRAFTLPVPTTALVVWPMALGALVLALCWVVLAILVLRPSGAPVPLLWPAVSLAALVVWVQALMWCPFPLTGLRVFVAAPVVGGMAIAAALGAVYEVAPFILLTVSAALIPIAYVVGHAGLTRARRGDCTVWHWPLLERRTALAGSRPPFASAADALFWLDWRRNGYVLPLLIGMFLVPELAVILVLGAGRFPPLVAGMFLTSVAIFPVVMAGAAGASLGSTRAWGSAGYVMSAFTATRPVASAEIIAVKLRVAVRIFLVTWSLGILVMLAALPVTQLGPILAGWARALIDMEGVHGGPLLVAGFALLTVLNFKAMIDHLCIGLSGRLWIHIVVGVAVMVPWIGLTALISWIVAHPETHEGLLAAAPSLVALVLVLKLGAGGLVGHRLLRRRLVTAQTLARFAALWLTGAAVLVGLSLWLTPAEMVSPLAAGGLAAVLLLPMVRLGLAPLALEWNRHR